MELDDLSDYSRERIEDLDELLRKLKKRKGGPSTTRNTALPYASFGDLGDTARTQSIGASSDEENPMTIFQDQGKLKEK
jgi:hypothetical protein